MINGAKVFGPLGSYLDTNGPQALTVRGANDGADFNVKGFVSQTALDATGTGFPNDNIGNYKLQIDTGTTGGSVGGGYDHEIKFNLGGDAYPTTVPLVTVTNGAWSDGKYFVSDSSAVTQFSWTFSDYIQPSAFSTTGDVIVFSVRPTAGGSDVVRVQYDSSNPGSYTLAANSLTPGTEYIGELFFARIVDKPDDISGVTGVVYYSVETTFKIQAVPEPSTWAMIGLGAVMIEWWRRRALGNRA